MTIFENLPAIFRMIMIFLLLLICIRKKLSLGNAFMLGTLRLPYRRRHGLFLDAALALALDVR